MNDRLAARDYIAIALRREAARRQDASGCEWIDNERLAVAIAANQWAETHGLQRRVTVDSVLAVEGLAVGHVDYVDKLALYVADILYPVQAPSIPGRRGRSWGLSG